MKTSLTYRNLIVALVAILFTFTFHNVSDAQTFSHIYVDAVNGANAPTGRGAAASPYKSITYALLISTKSSLPDPWHVYILPGTYNSDPAKPPAEREVFPLNLRQEMIFEGTTTAEECIIDAQHLGSTQVEILRGLDTEGVTIRNLTIQNMERIGGAGGIVLWDLTGTKETPSSIEACIVHNNGTDGVGANMPLVLTGNTFSNNRNVGVWSNKSVVATDNIFRANGAGGLVIAPLYNPERGGDSTGDITGNTFENNGRFTPGGLYVYGTLKGNVTHNTFIGNKGSSRSSRHAGGGGFFAYTFIGDLAHNTFANNQLDDGYGGGFYARNLTGNISHNTFTENSAEYGGNAFHVSTMTGNVTYNKFTSNFGDSSGINLWWIAGKITHNIFDSNSSEHNVGGIYLGREGNVVEISNNIFFNNTGRTGSIRAESPIHCLNNLFMISDELSEGVANGPVVWVNLPSCYFHNNIFTGMQTAIYIDGTFNLPITHNLFHDIKTDFVSQGGSGIGNDLTFWELLSDGASNNLEGDPRLVDPVTNRDFHLQATSPAIDAGTNDFAPEDDLDGVARPVGATVDIGPYEYGGAPVQDDPPVVEMPIVPDDPISEPVAELPPPEPTLKLYWATRAKIQRGDLDGANIEDVLNREAENIALDAVNGKIYWSHADNGIYRANLADGTNIEQVIDDDIWAISGGSIALDIAGGKMYWTNGETDSIFRANLNGTNSEELLQLRNTGTPLDIALDLEGGKMYWTQWDGDASISRADLDGANVEPLINTTEINDIALDVAGGKMYWTNGFNGIGMANLDGSNATSFETPNYITGGLTLNLFDGTMYWIDGEGSEIRRGNLDGSQQQTILTERIADTALYGSVVEPVPPVKMYPAWDVNEDGKTDITDLVLVATALGSTSPANPRADVNGDGTVNIQDLILVATHLGEVAGPAAPVLVALPERLTPDTLQQVLDILRSQDDGSVAFRRAIANVEQLLTSLTPEETALLANYPNPFNPETWIPYQLATPTDVTLRIHAIDGSLVRTLSLGHKAIGVYQTRSRAAYWDGKNEVGEPVASGVYFYTLSTESTRDSVTAGDFTATRKMLIRK